MTRDDCPRHDEIQATKNGLEMVRLVKEILDVPGDEPTPVCPECYGHINELMEAATEKMRGDVSLN